MSEWQGTWFKTVKLTSGEDEFSLKTAAGPLGRLYREHYLYKKLPGEKQVMALHPPGQPFGNGRQLNVGLLAYGDQQLRRD
jgi:hypothetical protein